MSDLQYNPPYSISMASLRDMEDFLAVIPEPMFVAYGFLFEGRRGLVAQYDMTQDPPTCHALERN